MTLKEQFENAPKVYNQNLESFIDYTGIADKFAIRFADWIRVCKLKGRPYDFENIHELLEIYKTEINL